MVTLNSDSALELDKTLRNFLDRNNLQTDQIDVLISGKNGDSRFVHFYDLVEKIFSGSALLGYKHLVGEYRTSSSFALWLAAEFLNGKAIHPRYILRKADNDIKTALIYTNFMGNQHSFILVKS